MGTAVAQWLRCCATNQKVAGSIPACVSGFLIDIKSFRSHYGPGVDSASNRNKYQKYFLEAKGGRCVRLKTLPPSCAVVMKSANLNFLEPSGPLQACNGTAFTYSLFNDFLSNSVGRDSSVGIAARYGLDAPGTESGWKRDFLSPSKPVLGPTYPPVQWTMGLLPGRKVAGVWSCPPTPSSAEVHERVELYLYSPSGPSWSVLG